MQLIDNEKQMQSLPRGMVLTIGNFDGVHRGHQTVLNTARNLAKERGTKVAAMTFDPHPAVLLKPDAAPGILTPLPMKKLLIESLGIHHLIVLKDSLRLLNMAPEAFVREFLVGLLAPSAIVEGPDFTFGYGRSGSVETLREMGPSSGFEVFDIPYNEFRDMSSSVSEKCSSTAIRQLLEEGDARLASQILGRPYRLVGRTIPGRGIGRQIGFPTANIEPIGQVIPSEGVYAGYVVVGDRLDEVVFGGLRRPAAISVGRAKTFSSDHPLLLEAHLLENKVENLAGKWLGLDFMRFLRHQQRFDDKEQLKAQIARDIERAERMLF
jgi:riboflavin kinase/FMN adenylyltransferase